jgi:serine/threonine-protein kinase
MCPLGEGGMGSVWLAHNEALDIDVAIKVLRTDVKGLSGSKVAERLLQEARAAAKLGHPAIVKIHDFGITETGEPYVVMELLEGEDLASTMDRRGRIKPEKAIRSLMPIAHALVMAHDKHIVHRDIKPENIFFSRLENGNVQPKLIDFGVAKLNTVHRDERLTAVGAIMGSPGYMSPEQARGEDVDERADIWALCVVMYEIIVGRLPFEGKNYHALLRSIIDDDVPPLTTFGIDESELWEILSRGMTKDPDMRWQTMRELGVALADWLLLRGVKDDISGSSIAATWMRERNESQNDAFDTDPPPHLRARYSTTARHEATKQRDDAKQVRGAAELAAEDASSLLEQPAPAPRGLSTRVILTRAFASLLIVLGIGAIWEQGVMQAQLERYLPGLISTEVSSTEPPPMELEPEPPPPSEPLAEPEPELDARPFVGPPEPSALEPASDSSASPEQADSALATDDAPSAASTVVSPTPAPARAPTPRLKKPTF